MLIKERLLKFGLSHINLVFNHITKLNVNAAELVIVNFKNILMTEKFRKQYFDEHVLACLLIKAF
jgi:hypothetical protein